MDHFDKLNAEINEFHKFLQENKFSEAQMRQVFAPLAPKKCKVTTFAPIFLLVVIVVLVRFETISWHLSALGRILLIKLLPIWDWSPLKNQLCLITKTQSQPMLPTFNCYLCENLQQIDFYPEIPADLLKQRYLDVELPVIIEHQWPFPENFIENMQNNGILAGSKPCNLVTNIEQKVPTIKQLLEKSHYFDSFFMHFQNCHFEAMKQFRGFTPKPSFIPFELSPVQYNWLLYSRNYNVTQFRRIGLVEKYTMIGQIRGSYWLRLTPRNNCETECPQIDVKLKTNEAMIFGDLWELEYRPIGGDSVAAILEMH